MEAYVLMNPIDTDLSTISIFRMAVTERMIPTEKNHALEPLPSRGRINLDSRKSIVEI